MTGSAEAGAIAVILALDISRGSGMSAWQGVVWTLSLLELLRDAEPGVRAMRAPGWIFTF